MATSSGYAMQDVAYRLRIGRCIRILFDIQSDIIVIRRIGDRKEIYD